MPVTSLAVSTRERLGSMSPSKLSSSPTTSMPWFTEDLTTARMTALRPGASPPPVSTPMRRMSAMWCRLEDANGGRESLEASIASAPRVARARDACYDGVSLTAYGRLAQLGERRVRNAEVTSSSLVPSTNLAHRRGQLRGL